jgi:hypothetical protein
VPVKVEHQADDHLFSDIVMVMHSTENMITEKMNPKNIENSLLFISYAYSFVSTKLLPAT